MLWAANNRMPNEKWLKEIMTSPIFKSLATVRYRIQCHTGTGSFHPSALPPLARWLLSSDLSPHGLKLIAADPVITSSHSHVQRQERAIDLSVPKRKTYSRIQAANFPGSLIHQGRIHHLLMPTAITGTDNKITMLSLGWFKFTP